LRQRSTLAGHRLGHDSVEQSLFFQRTIGNQATLSLLARRDSTLPGNGRNGGDEHESVGENTAKTSLRGASWDFSKVPLFPPERASRVQPSFPPAATPIRGAIRAKLVVGHANDPLEQEADHVADQVMRMPATSRSVTGAPPQISRKCAQCEAEEEDKTQTLHTKPAGAASVSRGAPPIVQEVLRKPGEPLDAETRAYFEPRFGRDFSQVRLHTDAEAAASARALNAFAYAVNSDLVFDTGRHDPATESGRRLLAHELTHVLQQSSGAPTLRRAGDPSKAPKVLSCQIASDIASATDVLMFDNDVSTLTAEQKARLGAFAASWHARGDAATVRIDGFASERGTEEYNWQLSCARAVAVQQELLSPSDPGVTGIPQASLRIFMQGETSEFGDEAQNRRVQLFVPNAAPSQPPPTPKQTEAQSQAVGTEKESVYHATRDVLRDFLVGTILANFVLGRDQSAHVYGPDHPWTVELQGHPHMAQVRNNIYGALTQFCKEKSSQQAQPEKLPQLAGRDDFNLNTLSFGENAAWLFNDALNWLSWGALGQKSAYLFGSFRLAWYAHSPTCDNGLGSAQVKFYAWDVAHVGSAIRIPMTNRPLINIGDQPLGAGLPLNDVSIAWYWSTQYIFSY
jgi:outer membrane protein OmpA-like peptidoglycan-associated protein